jgi:DNA-binding PadR family transcriptional regulator
LGFVSRRPTYGHEIKHRIASTYAEKWVRISQPHIYYVLEKLKKARYLTSREEKVGNTPPRTVYSITEEGRVALVNMLRGEQFLYGDYGIDFYVVLAMLGFTKLLSAEESVAVIEKRRDIVKKLIAEMPRMEDGVAANKFGPIAQAIYEHRLKTLKTELSWLHRILKRIRENGWETFAAGPMRERRSSSRKKK